MFALELKVWFPVGSVVVIFPQLPLPWETDLTYEQMKEQTITYRPIESLRIGDTVQGCELYDRVSHDRFCFPSQTKWRLEEMTENPMRPNPNREYTFRRVL